MNPWITVGIIVAIAAVALVIWKRKQGSSTASQPATVAHVIAAVDKIGQRIDSALKAQAPSAPAVPAASVAAAPPPAAAAPTPPAAPSAGDGGTAAPAPPAPIAPPPPDQVAAAHAALDATIASAQARIDAANAAKTALTQATQGVAQATTVASAVAVPVDTLPPGARVVPTSGVATSVMTPLEMQARAAIASSTDPTGLYQALGAAMRARGVPEDQIGAALNSFGGTAGANGGEQLQQVAASGGAKAHFANTPLAPYFGGQPAMGGAGASLPGVTG